TPVAVAPPLPRLVRPRLLGRLEELTVSHAPGFTGAHLAALAVALPSLRRLTVSHCRSLVDLAFLPEIQRRQQRIGGGGGRGGGGGGKGAGAGESDRNVGSGGHERGEEDERELEEEEEEDGDEEKLQTEGCVEEGATEGVGGGGEGGEGEAAGRSIAEASEAGGRGEEEGRGKARRGGKGAARRRAKSAAAAVEMSDNIVDNSAVNAAGEEQGDHNGDHSSRGHRRAAGKQKDDGGGGGKLNRKARAAAKKNRSKLQDDTEMAGGGGGGDGVGRGISAEARGGKGGGKDGSKAGQRGDAFGEDDAEDVFQGMEFRVDGKTRDKLERLAAVLPREPGRKKQGRPSCIRFLQEACPRSAAECPWAHLAMHASILAPPKTLKFKPLVTHAQEPSKSSNKRATPPLAAGAKSTAPVAPRSATTKTKQPQPAAAAAAAAGEATATRTTAAVATAAALSRGDANSVASFATAEMEMEMEEAFSSMSVLTDDDSFTDAAAGGGADGQTADVCFKNLQFLEIHDCPALKTLEGLRCPALAAARVTSCRELTSLNLEAAVLSHLNLSGCIRLEPWELKSSSSSGGSSSSSLSELQVCV
ncbi:unnamed protein product, partial [Laminaria digitata]